MAAKANFKIFKSLSEPWDAMSRQVADYLTELGPEKVISVSHSHEGHIGVIIVWYWE